MNFAALSSKLDALLPAQPWAQAAVGIALLSLLAIAARYVVQAVLLRVFARLRVHIQAQIVAVMLDDKVLRRVARVMPSLLIQLGIGFIPHIPIKLENAIQNVALAFLVFHIVRVLLALLDALLLNHQRHASQTSFKMRSIKSYVQLAQLVAVLAGVVVMIAVLIDKSPIIVLSGLGAISAVLMLVFKDTLLSFTAGVQLAGNDMLRVGDWIEMPQVGADGDVIDIALNTVKVQNWDKTITTIPTWRLMSESYKNWRGMSESGGRRIKRTLVLDAGSIRFLTDDEIIELGKIELLADYMKEKREAVLVARALAEARLGERGKVTANRRHLTNLGTFRAYAQAYLEASEDIRKDMSLMARTLEPTANGVPLELYCFTATTRWVDYEIIQGNIFDHLLAILPEFGLRPFQMPSGSDVRLALRGEEKKGG